MRFRFKIQKFSKSLKKIKKLLFLFKILRKFSNILEKVQEKTKPLFIAAAIISYVVAIVMLAYEINPLTNLDEFLINALARLSIPFSIILLQELFELIIAIPKSTIRSAGQQFEIIALVILRSFFKDLYKLNKAVVAGEFSQPVQLAIIKVVSLVLITVLIIIFNRLIKRAGVERRSVSQSNANILRQLVFFILCIGTVAYLLIYQPSFDIMMFIRIVFTGMIVLDAVFFLWMISQDHEFDSLMFDGTLVISLILARFPLFALNFVALPMAVIGVALATGGLYFFIRPIELRFLGNPQEEDVTRFDLIIKNKISEIGVVNKKFTLFLKQFNVSDGIIKKIRLASEELLNNIIQYAYEDKKDEDINIGLALYENRLAITIIDEGKPFNPFNIEPPDTEASLKDREIGGLGIYLVRAIMNKVTYRRQAGRNVVSLLIHLGNQENSRTKRIS